MNNKKDMHRKKQRYIIKFFIFFILMFFVFNLNINAEQKSKAEEKKKPKLRFVIDEDEETREKKAILLLDSNDKEIKRIKFINELSRDGTYAKSRLGKISGDGQYAAIVDVEGTIDDISDKKCFEFHDGIDYDGNSGDPLPAIEDGKITNIIQTSYGDIRDRQII